MIGAIVGDIVGSRFEFNNLKSKDFKLFTPECFVTDDSVMTLAICDALLKSGPDFTPVNVRSHAIKSMKTLGERVPGLWVWREV